MTENQLVVIRSDGGDAKRLPDGTFVVTTPDNRTLEGPAPGRPAATSERHRLVRASRDHW
jgi:hypothetical protein